MSLLAWACQMHVRIATFGGWQSLGLLSPGHSMLHCPEGLARQALFSVPCLSPFGEREGNEGDIRMMAGAL